MSSVESLSWRDLLEGGDGTNYGNFFPSLQTKVKMTNATNPSVSKWIKAKVKIPKKPQRFPAGFFDNFTDMIDATQLDDSATNWLMSATPMRKHDGEATVETSFKLHYLNAATEIVTRNLPQLNQQAGQNLVLEFGEQQLLNVDVGDDEIEGFKPDGQIDMIRTDGSTQTVVILEAKAEKKVARAAEKIRNILAGKRREKFDVRCELLLQQIGAYCLIHNTRWAALYDDDCLFLVRFDELKYSDEEPDYKKGLGEKFSIEIVEDRTL